MTLINLACIKENTGLQKKSNASRFTANRISLPNFLNFYGLLFDGRREPRAFNRNGGHYCSGSSTVQPHRRSAFSRTCSHRKRLSDSHADPLSDHSPWHAPSRRESRQPTPWLTEPPSKFGSPSLVSWIMLKRIRINQYTFQKNRKFMYLSMQMINKYS